MIALLMHIVVASALVLLAAIALRSIIHSTIPVARRGLPRTDYWIAGFSLCTITTFVWYATAHASLLSDASDVRAAITRGNLNGARVAEARASTLTGWILDCTGKDSLALVRYARDGRALRRFYATDTTANIIGGSRMYSLDRLFDARLRTPIASDERQLHPAGRDLRLTLCRSLTDTAWHLLRSSGSDGAVIVQEVATGGVLAYAATGTPTDAPLGMRQSLIPGSLMKLATAAIWLENGMGERVTDCPRHLPIGNYSLRNSHEFSRPTLVVPREMIVYSCNVAAARMLLEMRTRLGSDALINGYQRLGFAAYEPRNELCAAGRPRGYDGGFWRTASPQLVRHLSPVRSALCLSPKSIRPDLAMLSIGQGPIDVSAVHMMRFLQAIGNDGVMLNPTFEWDLARTARPAATLMRPETARSLREAMAEVVSQGTASSVASELASLEGWSLAGKTATVEREGAVFDDGWFGGLVMGPDTRARYVVVVFLRKGGPGGGEPARIAAKLTRYLAEHKPGTEDAQ
jgi:cell division protein FtsI/penicillin-binding protein 2